MSVAFRSANYPGGMKIRTNRNREHRSEIFVEGFRELTARKHRNLVMPCYVQISPGTNSVGSIKFAASQ
jgi:hypothetical protein